MRECLDRRNLRRVFQVYLLADNRMAELAVLADDSAIVAHVIALMAAKASREKRMPDVIRMSAPVDFHLRENVCLVDPLHFGDRLVDAVAQGLARFGVPLGVEFPQGRRDALPRFLLARVTRAERAHRLSLDVGQAGIDAIAQKSEIDRAVWIAKDMARPVVAIDAIHLADFQLLELLVGELHGPVVIICDFSFPIFDPYPGNLLPLRIAGAVPDFIVDIHMPVDARVDPGARAAPAGLQQCPDLPHGVFFIMSEARGDFELGAEELLRPMALLARVLRRPQAVNGSLPIESAAPRPNAQG